MDKADKVVLELGVGEVNVGEGVETAKIKKKMYTEKFHNLCSLSFSVIWGSLCPKHLKLSIVYRTLVISYTYQTGGKIFHPKLRGSCLCHLPFVSFLVCMVNDRIQPCPDHQMPKRPIVFPSTKKKEISVKKLVQLYNNLPVCWMGNKRDMYQSRYRPGVAQRFPGS